MKAKRGNPNWAKGESGNPAGRRKGSKNKFSIADLQKALNRAKKKNNGVSLLDHVCENAYKDNHLAVCILKKMYPDLKQVEARRDIAQVGYAALTPEQACAQMDADTVGKKKE